MINMNISVNILNTHTLKFDMPKFIKTIIYLDQVGLRKSRGTSDQIANILRTIQKQREFQIIIHFCFMTMLKPLAVWITANCGIFLKRWEYQTATWEICMQVKKQQLELNMEQWTDLKSEKECIKAVHCHPAYLTYTQSTSCEMLGWMKHKLESRLPGEISITSDTQMTPPLWQKVKRNWIASLWQRRVKKLA